MFLHNSKLKMVLLGVVRLSRGQMVSFPNKEFQSRLKFCLNPVCPSFVVILVVLYYDIVILVVLYYIATKSLTTRRQVSLLGPGGGN